MATLEENGILDYNHEARQVRPSDLASFDYIFAMDRGNLQDLLQIRQRMVRKQPDTNLKFGRIMLFGDFGGRPGEEVGDPYYGAIDGFEIAFEQLSRFSKGFISKVLNQTPDSAEDKRGAH